METEYVKCEQCGRKGRVVGMEGEMFTSAEEERARVFVVIDCPECGHRSQPKAEHVES